MAKTMLTGWNKVKLSKENAETIKQVAALRKEASDLLAPVLEAVQEAAEAAYAAPKGKTVRAVYKWGSVSIGPVDADTKTAKTRKADTRIDLGV